MKKTVVFLEADCLHDFSADAPNLTHDKLLRLNQQELANVYNFFFSLSLKLVSLPPAKKKLSTADASFLAAPPSAADPSALVDQIIRRVLLTQKMLDLTEQELEGLKPAELALLPSDQARGG